MTMLIESGLNEYLVPPLAVTHGFAFSRPEGLQKLFPTTALLSGGDVSKVTEMEKGISHGKRRQEKCH